MDRSYLPAFESLSAAGSWSYFTSPTSPITEMHVLALAGRVQDLSDRVNLIQNLIASLQESLREVETLITALY